MKPVTTVFELSKILKLSPSTVSRALKNHPDIAPETRKKVLELAQKLDYEPNLYAVGLRTRRTKEFAVIVPNLSGFFYDSFISAVEHEARLLGYSIFILLSGDDPAVEIANLKVCIQRKVEGVFACITPQTREFSHFEKMQKIDLPLVFFDKVPFQNGFTKVCVADEQAARIAAASLISSRRKRILSLFGDMQMSISKRRHDAYLQVFDEHFLSDELIVDFATSAEEARQRVFLAFKKTKKPDAIFCMSDEILIGAMKAVQMMKLKVPDEIALISISNGFFPKLYHPEITYVETSGYKLGKLAFDRMIKYTQGRKDPEELIAESVLVQGGSL